MESTTIDNRPGYGHLKGKEIGIFRPVESGLPLLPTEVIALSKDGALFIGYVYKGPGGTFFCKKEMEILKDVTHYAHVNDVLMTDEFKSLLPKSI